MHLRQWPPGRTSISSATTVKPSGPHHCIACFDSIQARNTISRGASRSRVITSSCAGSTSALGFAFLAAILLLLILQPAQIIIETIETLLPEAAVMLDPARHILERRRFQAAPPPFCLPSAGDQPGPLQH